MWQACIVSYPTELVFADDRLVAVSKPSGLSLATSRRDGVTAVARILDSMDPHQRLAWGLAVEGLWLVHRLDVGTSGLVLLARDPEHHRRLVRALSEHQIEKTYLALVWGTPRPAVGTYAWRLAPDTRDRRRMRADEGGKAASSGYRVLASAPHVSLVELHPHTGRTHQLRVHLARAGHPVVGDDLYGGPRHHGVHDTALRRRLAPDHTFLHAWRLALPALGHVPALALSAPLPADFAETLAALGGRVATVARDAGLLEVE